MLKPLEKKIISYYKLAIIFHKKIHYKEHLVSVSILKTNVLFDYQC